MTYDYLVHYLNADGQRRTYGGPGHCIVAASRQEAIEKLKVAMPPQVALTWFALEVRLR